MRSLLTLFPQAWQDALDIIASSPLTIRMQPRFLPVLEATCAQLAALPGMGRAGHFITLNSQVCA